MSALHPDEGGVIWIDRSIVGGVWVWGLPGLVFRTPTLDAHFMTKHRDAAGRIVGGEDGAENTAAHTPGSSALLGKGWRRRQMKRELCCVSAAGNGKQTKAQKCKGNRSAGGGAPGVIFERFYWFYRVLNRSPALTAFLRTQDQQKVWRRSLPSAPSPSIHTILHSPPTTHPPICIKTRSRRPPPAANSNQDIHRFHPDR